ncbi:MAG: DUF362 domain-containing protein, partial [Planctomycetes bacterium]|nr:DUF362 domain-containing protein [Planctomycetota bacterium]
MPRPIVAVLRTKPESVLDDYARLMRLARYDQFIPKGPETLLKINISWAKYYPAVSTTPWQLEAVVKALLADGFERQKLIGAHNGTVVVNDHKGAVVNKHDLVTERYGLRKVHLNDPDAEWVRFEPKTPMLVLDKVYPDGIFIPKLFPGKSIIHLPTMKTHVFTTITGAMKNAFGGLLHQKRHWTHAVIHETLVDLLAIQKEIHAGLLAV